MRKIVLFLILAMAVAGCVGKQQNSFWDQVNAQAEQKRARRAVLDEQLKTADCGPYPDNYQEIVENVVRSNLKDPDSAKFDFSKTEPYKVAIDLADGSTSFHWRVYARVNAKNSYGGYSGFKSWLVDIRDGKAIDFVALPQ